MGNKKYPFFKYNPNIYESDYLTFGEGICQCCGNKVDLYIDKMYAEDDINCICLECVANGDAAEKFDGSFIQDADIIDNEVATIELFNKTPGYLSWQGENWAACCNDYCEYIGKVGIEDLIDLGVVNDVFDQEGSCDGWTNVREVVSKDGSVNGHLFKCLHCGKYVLRIDAV